jgi:SOS-response transcriptional repressor LexA
VILATKHSTLEPITLAPEDVEIQGVLVGQMRAYL